MTPQALPVTRSAKESESFINHQALTVCKVVKVFSPEGAAPWSRLWQRRAPADGQIAVDHVDLEIGRGEIFGVLGANGSGKSTLIRLVSTLLIPDAGRVLVFGRDTVTEEMAVKRMLNRVSVEAAFFKKLSAMENLLYAARLYGLEAGRARYRIVHILEQLGISKTRLHEPLEKMSRGMQQKVAIARALLTAPM